MLIKWITCQVTPQKKASFHQAQTKWHLLSEAEGFLGQWGGWNRKQPLEAAILSLWQTPNHYSSFMGQLHDKILKQNGQANTYHSIHVDHSDNVISFGTASSLVQTLPPPILHVSDWEVSPCQLIPFLKSIRTLPITGFFHQLADHPTRFRVYEITANTTTPQTHFSNAQLIYEKQIPLEPHWSVFPK